MSTSYIYDPELGHSRQNIITDRIFREALERRDWADAVDRLEMTPGAFFVDRADVPDDFADWVAEHIAPSGAYHSEPGATAWKFHMPIPPDANKHRRAHYQIRHHNMMEDYRAAANAMRRHGVSIRYHYAPELAQWIVDNASDHVRVNDAVFFPKD